MFVSACASAAEPHVSRRVGEDGVKPLPYVALFVGRSLKEALAINAPGFREAHDAAVDLVVVDFDPVLRRWVEGLEYSYFERVQSVGDASQARRS